MAHTNATDGLYTTRMKLFVAGCIVLFVICLARLVHIQMWPAPDLREGLARLKDARQQHEQFRSLRGDIHDRNDMLLATDSPKFTLQISYQLVQYADPKVRQAKQLSLETSKASEAKKAMARRAMADEMASLDAILNQCRLFVPDMKDLNGELARTNRRIWSQRVFQAWRHNCNTTTLYQAHRHEINVPGAIPVAAYQQDFRQAFPDPNRRLLLVDKEVISEMNKFYTLFVLPSDRAVLDAQMEFAENEFVRVASEGIRFYPRGMSAAQTLGWVGPVVGESEWALFADDDFKRYRLGDVCGRDDGVEYLCEPILRGRRGYEKFDLDGMLIDEAAPEYGRDVTLTLDIALQEAIEAYLLGYGHAIHCKPGMAVVVIEVGSADILALVSLPYYDLNTVRRHYGDLIKDDNDPLINRALNKHYKPGSTAKPIVLATGLENRVISPGEVISCPSADPPRHWPRCWIWRSRSRVGHDVLWGNNNNARNAIKGSCNIYFSRLAEERIPPRTLQEWLFKFGYGRQIPLPYPAQAELDPASAFYTRRLRQGPGIICSRAKDVYGKTITSLEETPPLDPAHRRLAGMGEGVFSATILQIANTMATLARSGMAITPRLFKANLGEYSQGPVRHSVVEDLDLSDTTLKTVLGGMDAVVNESGGTANEAFDMIDFAAQNVKVYGKTGSTQDPNNALFAGFARDKRGKAVALALVVEGGRSGSSDAAPLARDIFQLCINAKYLGKKDP